MYYRHDSPNTEYPETRSDTKISFSVIMPTYNHCSFIRRAITSLMAQTYPHWELIIVNDGSNDDTIEYISDFIGCTRIKYIENTTNRGFGFSLNRGIDAASYEYIAYLPADDFFYTNHLKTLAETLVKESVILAYSGVRFDESKSPGIIDYCKCNGAIPGYCTQLVQVAHRKTLDRWTEREECVSDDLFYLFWNKLADKGIFAPTNNVTCEWTNHPDQHHKICGERYGGGLNKYRAFYNVTTPIRFRSNRYKTFDETEVYAAYRAQPHVDKSGLKILLVGELAYNPERIYALEKSGHKLYGLWSRPRFGYSTVGPLPFGNVEEIPYINWQKRVAEIQPDVIYALLSTSAIDLANEVLNAHTGIPFVWHFKEGPQEAMKDGLWPKLINLYTKADGRIYLNEEERQWIEMFTPPSAHGSWLLLDGDMPLNDYFCDNFSKRLSETDGEIHTLIVGRIVGLNPSEYLQLAQNRIHLHIYSENSMPDEIIRPYLEIDSDHIHIHPHCPQTKWSEEFSKYDAGWLHCIESSNYGSILKFTWSDMNLPARISTYLVAGIPMIQKRNSNHAFAQRSYIEPYGFDIKYDSIDELISYLRNPDLMAQKRENVMKHRHEFSFEANEHKLTDFLRQIANTKRK